MQPRLTVVTLGVRDLTRSREFYCEKLGYRTSSSSNEHIIFLDAGGIVLALFGRDSLAQDAHIRPNGTGFGGITLARNEASKSDVDSVMESAKKAGATILKPAQETFWGGYSGYFADLDGYPWEVAYNPHWSLTDDGRVLLP